MNIFKKSLVIPILLVIVVQSVSEVPPTIKLTKWLATDSRRIVDWVDNGDGIISKTGNVYTVTSDATALLFQCKASYPIKWEFLQAEYMLPRENSLTIMRAKSMRVSKDNLDSDSEYIAQIILYGDNRIFNGNYTCQSTIQRELQNHFYLFWEGAATDQSLVLYGRNFTVATKSKAIVTFPCYVTRPDSEVSLFKLEKRLANDSETNMEDTWEQLQLNSSIEFDPTKGFTFYTAELPGLNGKYKCESATEGDFLLIEATDYDTVQVSLNEEITSNATFRFEVSNVTAKQSKFTCCSSTNVPPRLSLYYCDTPTSCEMNRQTVASDWGFTMLLKLKLIRRHVNGSCVSIPRLTLRGLKDSAVLARCFGDGINILREMFFPLVGEGREPYMNWGEADAKDLVSLKPLDINDTLIEHDIFTVFLNQTARFSCKTSPYYYSVGARLVIGREGGRKVLPVNGIIAMYQTIKIIGEFSEIQTEVNITPGIQYISCFAPVWNSTEWVTKTIRFNILTPELKITNGLLEEHIYWTINDTSQELKCQMSGNPVPEIFWTKNNGTTVEEYNITNKISGNEIISSLHIGHVTHETQGEFKCRGNNFAGSTEKVFYVFVQERKPWGIILVVGFILFWLFGGILFFAWRMKSQRNTLQVMQNSTYNN